MLTEAFLRTVQTGLFEPGRGVIPVLPENTLAFRRWRIGDAKKIIGSDLGQVHRWAWGMYGGDHWQGGWGWAGPMAPAGDPDYDRLYVEIAKMFCSRNVIREIASTHQNGILGRMMKWSFVPIRAAADERGEGTPEELKTLTAEASALIRDWLRTRNAHAMLRQLALDLLMPPGRGMLRLFVPRGALAPVTAGSRVLNVDAQGVAEALAKIWVEKPSVESSRVYTDPETMREGAVTLFRARASAAGQFQDAAQVVFLDESGERTVIQNLYEDQGSTSVAYQMGGRLTAFQVEREPLITRQLIQQNRIVNFAETIIPRTLQTAGFLDRIMSGVQLNGTWVKDPTTGKDVWVIDPNDIPRFGPAESTYLSPQVYTDEEGRQTLAPVQVHRGEPVQPMGAIASSDHLYNNMKREAGQAHLVPNEVNEANLVQFGLTLLESALPLSQAGARMIEGALAFAEALAGQPGKYTSRLRAQVGFFLNIGPVAPEQRAALIQAFEKSILDRETVQEAMGVEDVDEVNDRIAAQPGAAIDLTIRMVNAYKMLRETGLGAKVAAKKVGFTDEDAAEIEQSTQEEEKKTQAAQAAQTALEAKANASANGDAPSQTGRGLRSARAGRPSGTANPGPGQGQNQVARALSPKPNGRRQP